MRRNTACLFLFGSLLSLSGMAQTKRDSTQAGRNYMIDEVVVTGTRNETDVRHLPMTISVVSRQQIEKRYEPSLLPLLTEQVPGLFTTSRGVMGYGVSGGAAGGMSLRGIGGSPTVHGVDGTSDSGCLSIDDGRKSRSVTRPRIRALWFECNGWSD